MKTRYKHIYFVDSLDDDNKPAWLCYNKADEVLGRVEYYPTWKQYVFEPEAPMIVFSKSCLLDILHFMGQL